jgi:hypothetical protein
MSLLGTYCGIVENVNDPLKLGRVKVRVPHVYGASDAGGGVIGTNDLPWALPAGMPAGGGAGSGGFSHLPSNGDHVYVRFLDGEPEKPIWEWGMQTQPDAQALPLHQYEINGKTVGKPKRAAWTRYGHTVELNADGVIVTTSQGYRATFTNGDTDANNGLIQVVTPLGNMLEIDDDGGSWTAYSVEDLYLNVGDTITAQARAIDFTMSESAVVNIGTTLDATVNGNLTIETLAELQLSFVALKLGLGTEPFVLGTQLVAFLESLLTWLTTHTHGNGNLGSPTTPPIIPPVGVVQPDPATLVSTTIFGQ